MHVTPSAVSQRIKALEQRVGQVLVVREKPCRATAAGVPLLRLAAHTALLATWFTGVFTELDDVVLDIRIEDQDHSARLLREGVVMGAVTTERTAVPGCRVQSLGVMRYVPVAGPAFVGRYLSEGFTVDAVAAAPSLAWNRDDALQDMLVRRAFRRSIPSPVHYVPTADGFGSAVRAGLGW